MVKYLFIILFFMDAVLNIYACVPPVKEKLRRPTKCFLMPLLACIYLVSAKAFSPIVLFGILCGFAGDVFLLGKEKSWPFAAGLFSFAVGHVLYSVYMWGQFGTPPSLVLLLIGAAVYLAGTYGTIRMLWPRMPKMLCPACTLYMLDISFMSISALMYALHIGNWLGWMAFVGSLLFVLSDSVLSFSTFRTRIPGRHLIVMVTYIAAQVMLVTSFMLTGV